MTGLEGVATCDLCGASDDHRHDAAEYARQPGDVIAFLRLSAAALSRVGDAYPDAATRCSIVATDLLLYADDLEGGSLR